MKFSEVLVGIFALVILGLSLATGIQVLLQASDRQVQELNLVQEARDQARAQVLQKPVATREDR